MKVMRAYILVIFGTAFLYSCLPDPLGVFSASENDDVPENEVDSQPAERADDLSDGGTDAVSMDEDEPFDPNMSVSANAAFKVAGDISPVTPNEEMATFGWSDLNFTCTESNETEKSPGYIRVFVKAHDSDDVNAQFLSTENTFALPCPGNIEFRHANIMEGLTYNIRLEILAPDKATVMKTMIGSFSVPEPAVTNEIKYELLEQT